MDNFDLELSQALNYNLDTIANKCKEILQDEITKQVYDNYTPHEYHRTFQLRENVRTEIKDGVLYVYINTGTIYYEDFYGNDVTNEVPYYVNYGHNSEKYKKFMLFQYPSRGFIQSAKERIQRELGLEVEIMSDANN